ncbi:hypothetical protein VPH35_102535 [Triticum aestivum]
MARPWPWRRPDPPPPLLRSLDARRSFSLRLPAPFFLPQRLTRSLPRGSRVLRAAAPPLPARLRRLYSLPPTSTALRQPRLRLAAYPMAAAGPDPSSLPGCFLDSPSSPTRPSSDTFFPDSAGRRSTPPLSSHGYLQHI